MAVINVSGDSALNRLYIINAPTEECIDIGIVNLPLYVTIYLLLTGTSCFHKVSSTDVAFRIIFFYCGIRVIGSCEIEAFKLTTCHRYWNMWRSIGTITMRSQTEIIDIDITTHMDIVGSSCRSNLLSRNKLFEVTAKKNKRRIGYLITTHTIPILVLHLVGIDQTGVRRFEPSLCLEDSEIKNNIYSIWLLCLTSTGNIQKVETNRTNHSTPLMMVNHAIIRLIVVVQVCRHDSERHGST